MYLLYFEDIPNLVSCAGLSSSKLNLCYDLSTEEAANGDGGVAAAGKSVRCAIQCYYCTVSMG